MTDSPDQTDPSLNTLNTDILEETQLDKPRSTKEEEEQQIEESLRRDGESPIREGPSPRREGESSRIEGESLRREGESPRREGESPRREGESPRREGESPRREGESPSREDVSPRREGESPRREGESPRREGESPRREGEPPRREGESPRREGESPRREGESPRREGESPRTDGEPPRTEGEPPRTDRESPRRDGESPRREGVSPRSEGESPRRERESPRREGESPRRGGVSPRRDGESPRRDGESPRREGESPRREGESPRREGESTRREGESPRREGQSPRREGESPRREGESPRREGESPRREGESPRRHDESPRGREESPRGEESPPRGEKVSSRGEEESPSGEESPPREGEVPSSEEEESPRAEDLSTRDGESLTTEGGWPRMKSEWPQINGESLISDGQSLISDGQSLISNGQSLISDGQSLISDGASPRAIGVSPRKEGESPRSEGALLRREWETLEPRGIMVEDIEARKWDMLEAGSPKEDEEEGTAETWPLVRISKEEEEVIERKWESPEAWSELHDAKSYDARKKRRRPSRKVQNRTVNISIVLLSFSALILLLALIAVLLTHQSRTKNFDEVVEQLAFENKYNEELKQRIVNIGKQITQTMNNTRHLHPPIGNTQDACDYLEKENEKLKGIWGPSDLIGCMEFNELLPPVPQDQVLLVNHEKRVLETLLNVSKSNLTVAIDGQKPIEEEISSLQNEVAQSEKRIEWHRSIFLSSELSFLWKICNSSTLKCKDCPEGWNQANSSCYILSKDKLSWQAAFTQCFSMKSFLAVPPSETLQQHLTDMSVKAAEEISDLDYIWVGCTRFAKSVGTICLGGNAPVNEFRLRGQRFPDEHQCFALKVPDPKEVIYANWVRLNCSIEHHYFCLRPVFNQAPLSVTEN